MKLKALFILILISSVCAGQGQKPKTVSYAGNIIAIPDGYKSKSEFHISGNGFSAEWIYFPTGADINDIGSQLISQFETQLPLTEKKDIAFMSSGNQFTGEQYVLNSKSYIVLGFGTINEQPIFLNMSFKAEPKMNVEFEEVVKNFILFK